MENNDVNNQQQPMPVNPIVLTGNLLAVDESLLEILGKPTTPAKWNNIIVGEIYNGIELNDYPGYKLITRRTLNEIVRNGYNRNDPASRHGITALSEMIHASALEGLASATNRFLHPAILRLINDKIISGGSRALENVRRALRHIGLSEEELINQIRFSFVFNMTAAGTYITPAVIELGTVSPPDGWGPTIEMINSIEDDENGVFRYREEVEFAIILSVHCNAKDYSTAYKETIERRMKAYYSQHNYHFANANLNYLTEIFAESTIAKYHDYFPREVRRAVYLALKEGPNDNWRNYLLTLLEWNSMSLIRETYRYVVQESPRNFLIRRRYINEIKVFMRWWATNNGDTDDFRYTWYLNPSLLEEVSHDKLLNLYSCILKICKEDNLMANYKPGRLTPNAVSADDILVTTSLTHDGNNQEVDNEYLNLIHRRRGVVNNIQQGPEELLNRLLQALGGGQQAQGGN